MSRRIIPALVATILLVAACSGTAATSAPSVAPQSQAPESQAPASESPPPPPASPASAAAGACAPSDAAGTVKVSMANIAFDPATISAKVGDVVTWTNNDTVQHTATVKSDPSCTTQTLAAGASGGITFTQPGTYDYFCKIHPTMTGKIEVTS